MSRSQTTEPRYGSFRWFVLLTLFVVTGTTALGLISPAPLIFHIFASQFADPSKADPAHVPGGLLDIGQVAWMTMGYFNFAVAVAALLGGYLVDRLGFVKIYFIGATLVGLGWLLVGFIPKSGARMEESMIAIRTLQGLGTGPIMASSAAVAATRFPIRERSIVTGTQGAAMAAGVGLGQAFMPKIFDAKGGNWQASMISLWPVAVVALVLTAVVAFGPKPEQVEAPAAASEERVAVRRALRAALLHPVTWAAIACVFVLSWVYQAFNDLSPVYLTAAPPLGTGFKNGSALLGIGQVFNFAGAFVAGALTERVFRGRVRPGIIIGFSFGALFGLGMLLPAAVHNAAVMGIVVCVAAFFFAWINPNALAYIAKTYPANIVGKLGGFAMGLGIFGGTLGVAAGARALSLTHHYTASITIMSTVCALGIVPVLFLRQKGIAAARESEPAATTATQAA